MKVRKVLFLIVAVFLLCESASASSDDGIILTSGKYTLCVRWYMGNKAVDVHQVVSYWDLIAFFESNRSHLSKVEQFDWYQIHFSDGIYSVRDSNKRPDLESCFASLEEVVAWLIQDVTEKYNCHTETANYFRLYRLNLPYKQGDVYPDFSPFILESEFFWGAVPSMMQSERYEYLMFYFDYESMSRIADVIQRYNFSTFSRIVTRSNLEDFLRGN